MKSHQAASTFALLARCQDHTRIGCFLWMPIPVVPYLPLLAKMHVVPDSALKVPCLILMQEDCDWAGSMLLWISCCACFNIMPGTRVLNTLFGSAKVLCLIALCVLLAFLLMGFMGQGPLGSEQMSTSGVFLSSARVVTLPLSPPE